MASKYYNPRLAASVSAAKNAGFFNAGQAFGEGFKAAQKEASPYVLGTLKEYQEDIEDIYNINFDPNGIALDKIEGLTNFLKQQRDAAFQERQKGIIPGKEATGKALLNVKGAANLAKGHGALAQGIQELLKDPSKISKANEEGAIAMLNSVANAKIDYNDPDGNFFVLGDGSKHSMESLKNELNKLIIEPNEAYNEFFEFVEAITPKKESFEGSTYYTFDEVDINKIQTKLYNIADKYGRDFVWDALSNENPYKGVTVSQFIDPELKLQGLSKSEIEKIIAKKYNLTDSTEIFEKAKELVVQGYTEAAKNTYPDRRKKLKPEKPTGTPTNERYVAQISNRIIKSMQVEQGTMNESTFIKMANETLSPSAKRAGKLFTDRNEGKTVYVQNALKAQEELGLQPSDKKSKANFAKEFDELYPRGAGNVFLNGNLLDINLSDPRAIGEAILGQSGVSDYEKFISDYLPPLSVPSIKRASTGPENINMTAEEIEEAARKRAEEEAKLFK